MKLLLIIVLLNLSSILSGQSGAVLSGGLSFGTTSYPLVTMDRKSLDGWNVGLTTRLGKNFWFVNTGLEVHHLKLNSSANFEPFSHSPGCYFLKIPLQLGGRLIRLKQFLFRASAGLRGTYILSIQDNSLGLNHNTMTDLQYGLVVGLGIDLGPLTFDILYEKGMNELYKGTGHPMNFLTCNIGFFF